VSVIGKLCAAGRVNSIADLYRLREEDIASLDRLGTKTAAKMLKNLRAATPIPLETILAGLSIQHCQTTTGRLVVEAGFDTVDKLLAVTEEQILEIPGLGPVKAAAVAAGVREHAALIREIVALAGLRAKVQGNLSKVSVCFTGALSKPRAVYEKLVRDAGGVVHSSVGAGLSDLVIADPESTSSKAKSARKYGVKCIGEGEFLALAGNK
jgi:DNA ligase (NAD+)